MGAQTQAAGQYRSRVTDAGYHQFRPPIRMQAQVTALLRAAICQQQPPPPGPRDASHGDHCRRQQCVLMKKLRGEQQARQQDCDCEPDGPTRRKHLDPEAGLPGACPLSAWRTRRQRVAQKARAVSKEAVRA